MKRPIEEFIEHELRCAKRYRRFVSLVAFPSQEFHVEPRILVDKKIIRECDRVFVLNNLVYILMTDTSCSGADYAFRRIRQTFGIRESFPHNIVTYPIDGRTAKTLIDKAEENIYSIH